MEFHAVDVPELQIVKMEKSLLHCEDCEDESFSLMPSKKYRKKKKVPQRMGGCYSLKMVHT